jgi:hypothetical protein
MMRRSAVFAVCSFFILALACSRHTSESRLVVEIPAGFTGNFVLEMGDKNAPPLTWQGDSYVSEVPRTGRLATSTLLQHPKVTFKNASTGRVWGFSQSTFTTGDGISVGGKIEFFVGTQKDYEAEEGKKNHSGKTPSGADFEMSGM